MLATVFAAAAAVRGAEVVLAKRPVEISAVAAA